MQIARNVFPEGISRHDRSMRRKLSEAQVALDIEKKFSKDKILELYLNQIDLGNRTQLREVAMMDSSGRSSSPSRHFPMNSAETHR